MHRVARPGGAHANGLFGFNDIIPRFRPAKAHDGARHGIFTGSPDPAKFTAIEFNAGIAHHLVIDVVGGDNTAGPVHVFDHRGWISRNMSTDILGDQPGVSVVASSGCKAHNEANVFTLVELSSPDRARSQDSETKRDQR